MLMPVLIPQEKDNYCVCSVLQGIFRKYHKLINQEDIAKNLTSTKRGFYVDDKRFKDFLNKNGFEYQYYFHNQTSFNEPDTLLLEMNKSNGFLGHHEHVYLLSEYIDPVVTLIDPANNDVLTNELSDLMKEMRKGEGFFGLVKKLNRY